jgi:glycerol uptake facilitator-like aquaporin
MSPFTAEIVGTALLILLGDGVVANVVLKGTKGQNSEWIVITFGWDMAVFTAVFAVAAIWTAISRASGPPWCDPRGNCRNWSSSTR